MTPEGFKIVYDVITAIPEAKGFNIYPKPKKPENIRDVRITLPPGNAVRMVLKALIDDGLSYHSTDKHSDPNAPSLRNNVYSIPWDPEDNRTLGFIDENVPLPKA